MKRKSAIPSQQNIYLALETLSSNYLAINKTILAKFGPSYTIYLINLIDKFKYFMDRDMLSKDGEFFLTQTQQTQQTGMKEYELRKCKRFWTELSIVKTVRKGMPGKDFYTLELDNLMKLLIKILKGQVLKNSKDKSFKIRRTSPLNFKGLINKPLINNLLKKENNKKEKKLFQKFDPLKEFNQICPEEIKSQEVSNAMEQFIGYRKEKKNPIQTLKTIQLLVNKLKGFSQDEIVDCLEESIIKGWTSVFPRKKEKHAYSPKITKQEFTDEFTEGLRKQEITCWADYKK